MYTGDDFNYAELIAGDDRGHSDALLGIFDAIALAASAALTRLAAGDRLVVETAGGGAYGETTARPAERAAEDAANGKI